jgi:hypothetical protein
MAILTRGQFAAIAQSKAGIRGLRGIVNESRMFSKSDSATSIFLSHSHHDKDVIEQAKIFFENLGNRVGSEGLFPPLSSHTTVRAVRHTAVRKDTDLE